MYFGENGIIKNAFHKTKKNKYIKRIVLFHKNHMVIKSHLNTLLDIYINAFPSPLCIKLSQMNAYAKYFDKNSKYINLLDNDKEILEKYNKIWNKTWNIWEVYLKKNLIVNQNKSLQW